MINHSRYNQYNRHNLTGNIANVNNHNSEYNKINKILIKYSVANRDQTNLRERFSEESGSQ